MSASLQTGNLTTSPHISIVDGSAGLRLLLAAFIKTRIHDAVIELIDPFSQTMRGAGITVSGQGSAVILGGLGTTSEVFDSLKRMHSRVMCPPIIILVSADLLAEEVAFIQAGAFAVLRKDTLSFTRLESALLIALSASHYQVAEAKKFVPPDYGKFSFIYEGQRQVLEIDGYRYLSNLASGQLAQVFFAEDAHTGGRAVIKVQTNAPIQNAAALQIILTRGLAINAHYNHNIVSVLDSGLTGSFPYVVLEFLADGDLRQRMQHSMSVVEKITLMVALLDALTSLHRTGYAHADLKPESIFFRKDGSIVLIDFNISVPFGTAVNASATGDVLGTPTYLSPEQGAGLAVDAATDIYAAGIVFVELLVGKLPFAGDTPAQTIYRHLHDEIPLLPLPVRHLQSVVDKMLAKNPLERFADAQSTRAALLPYLDIPTQRTSDTTNQQQ
jgi:Protein kinase domain